MSAARSLVDQTLDDRYRVQNEVGRTDSSVLYSAEDTRDGGRITLQVLRPELGQQAELRAGFLEASLALTHAEHPHLVGVLGAGVTHDALCYVALEPVTGTTLMQLLRHEALTAKQACSVAAQILAGLHAAHSAGVVHGRLRPSDVLVTRGEEGRLNTTLLGFGLAKYQPAALRSVDMQSIAPEALEPGVREPVSDLYSVAAILFEMLAGCPPFEGDTAEAVHAAAQRGEHLALASLRRDLPPALVALIEAGLSHDPRCRPATALEFARRLEASGAPLDVSDLSEHHWRSPIPEAPAGRPSRLPTQRAAAEPRREAPSDPVFRFRPRRGGWAAGDANEPMSESLLIDPRIPPPAATPKLDGSDPPPKRASSVPRISLAEGHDLSRQNVGWALACGAAIGALLAWLAGVV
ncbi:MAG TPA: serine/threonine-protein kinase [Polyangiaceae bacterium]|nr:serine/threonine-protein kinase [Polyangiaceae bacterium]